MNINKTIMLAIYAEMQCDYAGFSPAKTAEMKAEVVFRVAGEAAAGGDKRALAAVLGVFGATEMAMEGIIYLLENDKELFDFVCNQRRLRRKRGEKLYAGKFGGKYGTN